MKESPFKNIIVPIDSSPVARHVLRHAERIAELTHARLTLLHVVEPIAGSVSADPAVVNAAASLVQEMEIEALRELQKTARISARKTGLHVDPHVSVGPVALTIRRKAAEVQAELIVMGTHGATGFVETLLGSNTYRVAALSRIPVLSVHRPITRNGYSQIVYPVRSNVRALDKFSQALVFARLFKARVHIIGQILPGNKTGDKRMRALCAMIKRQFAEKGVEAKTLLVSTRHLADAVLRFVQLYSGSLVVINQDRDFHIVELFQGSFPKNILHRTLSPVLSVPGR